MARTSTVEIESSPDVAGAVIIEEYGRKCSFPVVFSSPSVDFKKVLNIYIEPASGK